MVKWQIASSLDKTYIFELATSRGWYDIPPKVQVKRVQMESIWWVIEPYEEGCNCPDLVQPPEERIKNENFIRGG